MLSILWVFRVIKIFVMHVTFIEYFLSDSQNTTEINK